MIKLKNIITEAAYGEDESQYSLKDRKKLRATEQKLWKKVKKAMEDQIDFYVMNRTDIK